ncbi:MAG: phage tail protein [Deltaproteobacteria bacterium]|nr:phage tail protein [Deltaproteobacteria bacterium]MBZ0219724.1 phage tail protein [Deltaproteobacteria bacterium]
MNEHYPPWGFYYKVEFSISKNRNDVRFQSVSGLSMEYEIEEYKEGGENRFVHKLPVRTKYPDLMLKRGMLTDSSVIEWCLRAFRDRDFEPSDVTIILMNEKSEPLRTWKIAHAVPKKWVVSDFNANENSIVVETLEFSYRCFAVQ